MIFNPGTYVRLLSNVPLDNTYTHTLSFSSPSEQSNYFTSKAVRTYDKFTYQRHDIQRGDISKIRIPEVVDNLFNVNYLMFRNNNFGDKWFYCFVTKLDFINDNLTEITFEIDIVQTWYFDYRIQPSFVVREHTNNDAKYANLVDEDLDTGEYIVGNYDTYTGFQPQNCFIVICASFDAPQGEYQWKYHAYLSLGYQYNALHYYAFSDSTSTSNFIRIATENAKDSGIITIFMYPQTMWPDVANSGYQPSIQTVRDKGKQLQTFGNYKPKNNKLYNYPYSFIYVTNNNGSFAEFRYEYFKGTLAFAVASCLSASPDFVMCPMNYKQANNPGFNWNEAIGMGGYPICSWISDTYKAYLAQNASRLGASYVTTGVKSAEGMLKASSQALMGVMTNSITQVASGAINSVTSTLDTGLAIMDHVADRSDRKKQPPQANSTFGNETAFALNLRNFGFYNMQITEEYAKIIDEYFSMFGYKTLRVKIPNRTGRRSWNYVKTQGIQIIGNMPADDLARLQAIYDSGITFWHNKDVGNYTLDNSIIGGGKNVEEEETYEE